METIIETKICIKCGADFDITDRDRKFYKRMDVPDPTMCPTCRMQRLMSFRNERTLYKAKCAYSGVDMLSIYPPDTKAKVYDQKVWWSDKWDALSYGRDFDFNRPFFEQFEELFLSVPLINLGNRNNENSDYCNDTNDLKNCYLCFNSEKAENFYYCNTGGFGRDCVDIFWGIQCELCYECSKIIGGYHCFYCFNSMNISDCYFSENLVGCKNCFGCVGLHQKEYHIYNERVSKEKFEEFMKAFQFTYENIQKEKKKFAEHRLKFPHKNLEIIQSEDCLGDYLMNSKNCNKCFDIMNSENCKYVWDGIIENGMDCFNAGLNSSFLCDCMAIYRSSNVKHSYKMSASNDCLYCSCSFKLKNCFGCTGLKHQEYCILNKKYTKEEYEKLLPEIISHMKKTGEWGEFFPPKISPIGYNDSVAQYYFPLDKSEALEQSFFWNDYQQPKLNLDSVDGKDLPNHIDDLNDEILNKAIKCEKDGKHFKIIAPELKFYRKHNIAPPHICPDCRHFERKAQMNPRILYDGNCAKCKISFKTTYSPDRPEIVYCEKCYLEAMV